MNQTPIDAPPTAKSTRWGLVRDVIAFQVKLALDGLRDVVLSPVSLIAALLGLLTNRQDPAHYFNRLMDLGYRSDHWINLFNKYNDNEEAGQPSASADGFIRRAESIVVQEYEKGGVVRDLKDRTDEMTDRFLERLDTARRARSRANPQARDPNHPPGGD